MQGSDHVLHCGMWIFLEAYMSHYRILSVFCLSAVLLWQVS